GRSIRGACATVCGDQPDSARRYVFVSLNAARLQGLRHLCTFESVGSWYGSDQRHRKQKQMSRGATAMASNPAADYDALLRPLLGKTPDFPAKFLARLQTAKLTFGDRVHCPFLRPFFLSPEDEQRVRNVAETIADLGERVVKAALEDASLLAQL